MADVRPFRALRYDLSRADLALTIAPPYDIISPELQRALYDRSPYNIVRVEYGEQRAGDSQADDRYTRAACDLDAWRRTGVLVRDDRPAFYRHRQHFEWQGRVYAREATFAVVRLEEWAKGVIKPHEHTLASPKADRLNLLHATRTQVSPVYGLFRLRDGRSAAPELPIGETLVECVAGGQRHTLSAVRDADACDEFAAFLRECDVYVADGHHRYETALAYRDEMRARASVWTGDEPENFVLMALTNICDHGLLVLPTHRMVHPREFTIDHTTRIAQDFQVDDVPRALEDEAHFERALKRLGADKDVTRFLAIGLRPRQAHLLSLRNRAGVESLMPRDQPDAWRRLDVNVLQYGILHAVLGIDDAALTDGGAVTYTQDAREALAAVASGAARLAFLLNATPVEHVLAVADAGGRMPQKSTYFYPKLPTGLVMNALES